MIDEGRKVTVFGAMEAAMHVSDLYKLHDPKSYVNFRFTSFGEAVLFDFGYQEGREYKTKAEFTIQLNPKIEAEESDYFCELFEMLNEEMDRFEPDIRGFVRTYQGKEECV